MTTSKGKRFSAKLYLLRWLRHWGQQHKCTIGLWVHLYWSAAANNDYLYLFDYQHLPHL